MLQFMVIVHAAPGANNYSVFFDDVFHGFCAVGFLLSVLTFRGRRSKQSDSALSCSSIYYTLSSCSSFFFFNPLIKDLSIRDTITFKTRCLWLHFPISTFNTSF